MGKLLFRSLGIASLFLIIGCAPQRAGIKNWWNTSGKTKTVATGGLIVDEVHAIVEKDLFAHATDASDAVLKQFNAQGFAEAGHTLEAALPNLAIEQIPDFVMKLRGIWLPGQTHYTNMAADLGQLIQKRIAAVEQQTGHKILPDEATQVVENVIQGLSTAQPAALTAP